MENARDRVELLYLKTVTERELEENPACYLVRIEQGKGPFLIFADNKPAAILFGWDDYWKRFGERYPPGEKERMEEECEKYGG